MSKHTPGPWSIADTKTSIDGPDGSLICSITAYRTPTPRQACNARLIAAAPELLAALALLLLETEDDQRVMPQTKRACRAAVNKATGEQQ